MRHRKPTSIGDILAGLKASTPLGAQLEQAQIWARWPEIAGPRLGPHGAPKAIRGTTLYIETDGPVWMHRFSLHKPRIIKHINDLAGRDLIDDLFFTLTSETPPDDPSLSEPPTPQDSV